ncbi:hypothetical protein BJX70DRAFT_399114 [Aspergillus crustosus]
MASSSIRVLNTDNMDLIHAVQSGVVCFKVGPEEKVFSIHNHLVNKLCNIHKHNTALSHAKPRCVYLLDADSRAFSIFASWLYTGKLAVIPWFTVLDRDPEPMMLAKAYILGLGLKISAFCEAVVAAVLEKYEGASKDGDEEHRIPGLGVVCYVYEKTQENNLLRTGIVQLYLASENVDWVDGIMDNKDVPAAFLADLNEILTELDSDNETAGSCNGSE